MTVLVCMTPEEGGWIMRRWERPTGPWADGKLHETHVGGHAGCMYSHSVRDFWGSPPAACKLEPGERQ